MAETKANEPQDRDSTPRPEARQLSSDQLFDGDREIKIEHAGEVYRLRITRRNRLILQK